MWGVGVHVGVGSIDGWKLLKNLRCLSCMGRCNCVYSPSVSGFPKSTWTPKVCKIMASMAIIMGLGLLFYILFGFR